MRLSECQRKMKVALSDGASLTIAELAQRTGYAKTTIEKAKNCSLFVPDGERDMGGMGPSPMTYKLASSSRRQASAPLPSVPEAPPIPAIIVQALDDQQALQKVIQMKELSGRHQAALMLAKVWQSEDAQLKRIFEGRMDNG